MPELTRPGRMIHAARHLTARPKYLTFIIRIRPDKLCEPPGADPIGLYICTLLYIDLPQFNIKLTTFSVSAFSMEYFLPVAISISASCTI